MTLARTCVAARPPWSHPRRTWRGCATRRRTRPRCWMAPAISPCGRERISFHRANGMHRAPW